MRSKPLLLGEPINNAYAFRSIPLGAGAIKSGCTRKKYEELTESLIRAKPNSAEVFEIGHGETNAHYLIRIKNTLRLHLCTVKRQSNYDIMFLYGCTPDICLYLV
jgi:hypothetical protein